MKRRLYLGREKLIAGVCSGIADYLGIGTAPVRAGLIVLLMAGGVGIIFYVGAMLLMPERPDHIDDL